MGEVTDEEERVKQEAVEQIGVGLAALGAIALEIARGQPDSHLIFGQTLHLGAIQVSYFDQIIPLGFNHRGGELF